MKTCRYYLALAFCVLCQFFCSETASGQFKCRSIWVGGTVKEEKELEALVQRIAEDAVIHFKNDDETEFFLNNPVVGDGIPAGTTVHSILSLMILAEKSGNPKEFADRVQYYEQQNYTGISGILGTFSPQGSGSRSPSYVAPPSVGDEIDYAYKSIQNIQGNVETIIACTNYIAGMSTASETFSKLIPSVPTAAGGLVITWSLGTISTGIEILKKWDVNAAAAQIGKYKIFIEHGNVTKSADGTRIISNEGYSFDDEGWIGPSVQHPTWAATSTFWDYVDFMLWVEGLYGSEAGKQQFGKFLTGIGSGGVVNPSLTAPGVYVDLGDDANAWRMTRGGSQQVNLSFGEGVNSRCRKIEVILKPQDSSEASQTVLINNQVGALLNSIDCPITAIGNGQTAAAYRMIATLYYDPLDADGNDIGEFSTTISQLIRISDEPKATVSRNIKPIASPLTVQVARGGTVHIPLNAHDPDGSVSAINVLQFPTHSVLRTGNSVLWKNYFDEVTPGSRAVVYHHDGSSGSTDSFTFAAMDDRGLESAPATVTIQVVAAPSNPAIVTQPQTLEVETNQKAPVSLTGGSTVNPTVTRTVTTTPVSGQISQVVPGRDDSLIYTAPNTTGTQTLNYSVQDGAGNQQTATIEIKVVAPVPHAPVAANVAVSVTPGGTAAFKLKGTDADGPTLSYQVIANPSYGSVTGTAPNLTYTHNPANGTTPDTLEYRVTDPTGRTATAFVNFKIANTPPVIGAMINRAAAVGQSVSATLTATDTTGQVISYHLAPGSPGTINANQWSSNFSTAGAYTVTILARDRATAGSPVLSESTKSFTVIVGGYASFTDVPPSHPQYITIHDAAKTRGFVGYTEGTQLVFKPDQPITRGEFMTLLLKYSGDPVDTSGIPFPDVPSTHTHFEAIQTFKNRSVVIGYRSGNFGPDDYLERQEMAVIFTNILRWGWGDFPAAPFVDVPVPPPDGLTDYQWDPIYNAINQLKAHGLTNAANLYYRPFENATRVETVIMMDRYLGQAVAGGIGQDGEFTYSDNGTSVTITDYPEDAVGAVEIPASINGKPVISIGSYAFDSCRGLTSVTIPSSVTSIGFFAFGNCSGLTSVTIPGSVIHIGNAAFVYCTGLVSVTISNGVTGIGSEAFKVCSSLVGLSIPASVATIGVRAFEGCGSLTALTVDAGNANFTSLNGVLFDKTQTRIVAYPGGKAGAYLVPSGVTHIGEYAFAFCAALTGVTLPNSVTVIENNAFQRCSSLANVTFTGEGLTTIGAIAFASCTNLTNFTIPNGVTSIGTSAFYYCTILASVNIPESVVSLGSEAFSSSGLVNVIIPDSVTTLGGWLFSYCTKLKSVTIGSGVTYIPNGVFYQCTVFNAIYFRGNAPALGGANVFYGATQSTVYRLASSAGWGTTFGGRPVQVVNPTSITTHPASTAIVSSSSATLTVSASGTPPLSYQWYQGASGTTTTPVGSNSANYTTPALITTTRYWVKVTNAANPAGVNSNSATVTVNYLSEYSSWITAMFPGVTDSDVISPTSDPDHDSIPNAIELVVGGKPDGTSSDSAKVPSGQRESLDPDGTGPAVTGDYFRFSHRRTQASVDTGVTTTCEYASTLAGEWTDATHAPGVVKKVTSGGTGLGAYNTIDYFIPIQGSNPTVFARLKAVVP